MQLTIDKYTQMVAPLEVRDLDLANAFRTHRLDGDVLRCLRYMHDIESHTVCYLRDLLLTESHRDPRITTFLTTWAWEEQWHGIALAKVLEAHGEVAGNERISAVRSALGIKDRFGPLLTTIGSVLARRDFDRVERLLQATCEAAGTPVTVRTLAAHQDVRRNGRDGQEIEVPSSPSRPWRSA